MRGIIFSAIGVALLTTLAMVAVITMEHTKNTIPVNKTLLGGTTEASKYHIAWEYKGQEKYPDEIDVERGCAPLIVLNTRERNPIQTLARPYVTYVCGD